MDLNGEHVTTGAVGLALGWLTKLLHGALSARAQFQKVVDGQEAMGKAMEARFTQMDKRMDSFAEELRYQRRRWDERANGSGNGE